MATVISSGTSTVTSGVTLYYPTVKQSGRLVVSSGGVVSGANIESGGMEIVSSGGVDLHTTISSGGEMRILAGGSVAGTFASSGSVLVSGGFIRYASVGRGASMVAWGAPGSTGIVSSVSVISSGNLVLNSGAVGSKIDVQSGYAFVSSGGFLQDSIVSGANSSSVAEIIIDKGGWGHYNSVCANGVMGIRSGGSATATAISSGGSVIVSNGGLLSGGSVYYVGWVTVHSGGTAVSTTVSSGGYMDVSQGLCINPIL